MTWTPIGIAFGVALLVAVFVLGQCAHDCISASGEADYCFVRRVTWSDESRFELVQHVPWGDDRTVTRETTLEAAVAAAERIGCPLR